MYPDIHLQHISKVKPKNGTKQDTSLDHKVTAPSGNIQQQVHR